VAASVASAVAEKHKEPKATKAPMALQGEPVSSDRNDLSPSRFFIAQYPQSPSLSNEFFSK
jgi:hypothetical protein